MSTDAERAADLVRSRWEPYVLKEHAAWTWRMLASLYGEPSRHYHTLEHVAACLRESDSLIADIPSLDRQRMELALIWHDAVYVPGQQKEEGNERLSAGLLNALRDVITVANAGVIEYACTTIVATASHDTDWYGGDALTAVLDVDLSILGQDAATYDAYARAIRLEYDFVHDEAWRVGRGAFLAEMLGRKKIYTLGVMRDRYDARARDNMRREAAALADISQSHA